MVYVSQELIDKMARQIVREVDPERVVLFGSWARGEADERSDVDFLVVEREPFGPNRSRREEAVRIWECLYDFRVPKDILVYSVDEIDQWKDSDYHVIGKAMKEGKILYESDRRAP
jgi:predicted nucleotidyltransferase